MSPAGDGTPAGASRFPWLLALVALLAVAIREQFVLTTFVAVPIRGDILEYANYAWNLVHHGVLSHVPPDPVHVPLPDGYRMPGYPFLIALGLTWFPDHLQWIAFVLQAQVLLGAATVVLCGLLARQWLSPAWSLGAALLLALWPHHVAATGAMLSEVVFGFAMVAGLYCVAHAWNGERAPAAYVLAGIAFGYAWLVNPILLPFPFLLAGLLWRHARPRQAAVLLSVFLVPVLAMAIRDARIDAPESGSLQRARLNFVQGSWPDYHAAANRFRTGDPTAIWIMGEIDREATTLRDDPRRGMHEIGERFAANPTLYAKWYASKAWLLWSWQIQVGASDIYYLVVERSPLERSPVLRAIVATYKAINPLLTALTLAGSLALVVLGFRHPRWVPAAAVGGLTLYLTFAHMALQAEPRYAIAYRGLEAVVVMTTLAWCSHLIRKRRT
jgi:hypothetical protein